MMTVTFKPTGKSLEGVALMNGIVPRIEVNPKFVISLSEAGPNATRIQCADRTNWVVEGKVPQIRRQLRAATLDYLILSLLCAFGATFFIMGLFGPAYGILWLLVVGFIVSVVKGATG